MHGEDQEITRAVVAHQPAASQPAGQRHGVLGEVPAVVAVHPPRLAGQDRPLLRRAGAVGVDVHPAVGLAHVGQTVRSLQDHQAAHFDRGVAQRRPASQQVAGAPAHEDDVVMGRRGGVESRRLGAHPDVVEVPHGSVEDALEHRQHPRAEHHPLQRRVVAPGVVRGQDGDPWRRDPLLGRIVGVELAGRRNAAIELVPGFQHLVPRQRVPQQDVAVGIQPLAQLGPAGIGRRDGEPARRMRLVSQ